MTYLVTFTFDSTLFLELLACLSPLAYILVTIIMKRCFPIIQMTWTFPIGCNGPLPDEYFLDVINKNRLYPNLTISIWLHPAKLHNSVLSSFRTICRKRFRKISEQTVGARLCRVHKRAEKSHYQSEVFVCVSNNCAEAVDQLLIICMCFCCGSHGIALSLSCNLDIMYSFPLKL